MARGCESQNALCFSLMRRYELIYRPLVIMGRLTRTDTSIFSSKPLYMYSRCLNTWFLDLVRASMGSMEHNHDLE